MGGVRSGKDKRATKKAGQRYMTHYTTSATAKKRKRSKREGREEKKMRTSNNRRKRPWPCSYHSQDRNNEARKR